MTEPLLSRETLEGALSRLAERLDRRGVVGEVYVVGGAAMVLAYRARLATRDLDAVFAPDSPVRTEAWAVAAELGLPRSWLNDQASAYLPGPTSADLAAPSVFARPGLRVSAASPRWMLAMKVAASRRARDSDDIAFLAGRLGLGTVEEVVAAVAEVLPALDVDDRRRDVIAEALRLGG